MGTRQHNPSETPQDLKFSLIEEITHKFDEKVKVGSGGFGDVYWGIYRDEKIAVKKLYDHHPGFNDEAFKKEFNNSMKLRHPNTVRLVGYCFEIRHKHIEVNGVYEFARIVERVLCFEYCQGGSLDKYIYEEFRERDLDTRLKIIRGISEGLNYLHNGQAKRMYHLDLKPENILLDEKNMPKIADFGLSRFLAITKTHITSASTGTRGYMPPEYINEGKISRKFDVFSLGVIILQVLAVPLGYSKCDDMSPKCDDISPREFVENVHKNWNKRPPVMSSNELYRVKEYIDIALRCVEAERDKRPEIRDIVCQLQDLDAQYSVGPSSSRGPTSQMKDLALDPAFELRFPFEPSKSKEIPCCLQLTNNTNGFIAFNIKVDQQKYHAHPNKSTVQPGSYCNIVITSRAWNTAPPSTVRDSILVQSTKVGGDLSPDEIADNMFDRSTGNAVDQVELPVVYVPILQRPNFHSN